MSRQNLAAVLMGVAFMTAAASADTVLIDFNARNGDASAGDPSTSGWNLFDASNDLGTFGLVDSTGGASGFSIVVPDLNDSSNDGWDEGTYPPPVNGWAVGEAVNDYSWYTNASSAIDFVFTGLDDTKTYDFDIVISRTTAWQQDITLAGANTQSVMGFNSNNDGYANGDTVSIDGVEPTAAGEVTLTVSYAAYTGGGTNNGVINALQMVEVPEPATLALLALGATGLLRRRR